MARPLFSHPADVQSCNQNQVKAAQYGVRMLRYLKGTEDYGLFYRNDFVDGDSIVGYADAGYQSDPYSGKSQTGYVFLSGGAAISWRSQKQTIVTTSSNHSELIALYEASPVTLHNLHLMHAPFANFVVYFTTWLW